MEFEYKTKPYDHQEKIFMRSRDEEYFALFMEQGSGKTKIIIDTANWNFLNNHISGVVLFANKGVYGNWHYEELPKHSSLPYRVYMWRGMYKADEQQEFNRILEQGSIAWFLCNIDALPSLRFQAKLIQFIRAHPNFMAVGDETTSIRNFKSDRTKAAMKLAPYAKMRRIMSGLPNPQSPLDLYSQCNWLKPGLLGFNSYYAFKNEHAITKNVTYGNRSFPKITGYRGTDQLAKKIERFAAIIKLDECVDLPGKIYKTQYVELTDKQKQLYRDLVDRAVTYFGEHEITALNALSLMSRLIQIICGQMKVGPDEYVSIENNRLEALSDCINEDESKAIVWTSYRRTAIDILEKLGKDKAILLPGGLLPEKRQQILQEWKHNFQTIIVNPASSGWGVTMIESHRVFYYSNTHNLEHRSQSEARTHRLGITQSCVYTDFVAPGTIEPKILQCLKEKRNLADEVIRPGSFQEWLRSTI
jgi:SNF2 family DNA or RNA helicase